VIHREGTLLSVHRSMYGQVTLLYVHLLYVWYGRIIQVQLCPCTDVYTHEKTSGLRRYENPLICTPLGNKHVAVCNISSCLVQRWAA